MLKIKYHNAFKKDYKLALKRGCNPNKLETIITSLANQHPLPASNRDHGLTGNYVGCRECHIAPDWLLIYEVMHDELVLHLLRTGTHSDLF